MKLSGLCLLVAPLIALFLTVEFPTLPENFSQPWKYRLLSYGAHRMDQIVSFESFPLEINRRVSSGFTLRIFRFVHSNRDDSDSTLSFHRFVPTAARRISFESTPFGSSRSLRTDIFRFLIERLVAFTCGSISLKKRSNSRRKRR